MKIIENNEVKILTSPTYNYIFRKTDGYFARWGSTTKDDQTWSPFGPEIADIEITTSCSGPKISSGKNRICSFCYKSNTPNGKYMSYEVFCKILDKFPHEKSKNGKNIFIVCQIAFGVDAECKTNPDVWKIFAHCRDNGIIPNLTVASIDDQTAQNIAKYCGACAVSRYSDKNICYDTVDMLNTSFSKKKIFVKKKNK
jgi:hypothetical protein